MVQDAGAPATSGSAGWRRPEPAVTAGRSRSIRRRPGGCSDAYRSKPVALCSSPAYQDLTAYEICRDQQDPTAVTSVHRARSTASSPSTARACGATAPAGPSVTARRPTTPMAPIRSGCGTLPAREAGSGACSSTCTSSLTSMTAPRWAGGCSARLFLRSICMDHGRFRTQPLAEAFRQRGGDEMHPWAPAPQGPRIRPDAGSPAGPGVTASFSRPRASNDNPCCESLFRTLTTRHDYPAPGKDHEEQARSYIAAFVSWYNHEHRHRNLNCVTPMQRRRGEDRQLLERRTALTAAACQARVVLARPQPHGLERG